MDSMEQIYSFQNAAVVVVILVFAFYLASNLSPMNTGAVVSDSVRVVTDSGKLEKGINSRAELTANSINTTENSADLFIEKLNGKRIEKVEDCDDTNPYCEEFFNRLIKGEETK